MMALLIRRKIQVYIFYRIQTSVEDARIPEERTTLVTYVSESITYKVTTKSAFRCSF